MIQFSFWQKVNFSTMVSFEAWQPDVHFQANLEGGYLLQSSVLFVFELSNWMQRG